MSHSSAQMIAVSKDHLAKSRSNETVASSFDLTITEGIEWAITATFYAAVHYVQAYLVTRNGPITSHTQRDSAIWRDGNIKPIYIDYQELKTHSRDARYEATPGFTTLDLAKQTQNLQKVKSAISQFL